MTIARGIMERFPVFVSWLKRSIECQPNLLENSVLSRDNVSKGSHGYQEPFGSEIFSLHNRRII
jgi:hypothetical protein